MRARESSQEVSLFSFQGAGTLDLKREHKRDESSFAYFLFKESEHL